MVVEVVGSCVVTVVGSTVVEVVGSTVVTVLGAIVVVVVGALVVVVVGALVVGTNVVDVVGSTVVVEVGSAVVVVTTNLHITTSISALPPSAHFTSFRPPLATARQVSLPLKLLGSPTAQTSLLPSPSESGSPKSKRLTNEEKGKRLTKLTDENSQSPFV
jgi:hypothetical protein